ncbi:hypothetical protein [Roseovarius dicentrarchi]|uniref:hypothetical protein n=1 Tax=Roseovarius dicentrarchi TaxID=2250573 RepID=UPI000DE8A1FC|nr:hypothetical protein [Roseovarius dicentrarchi]
MTAPEDYRVKNAREGKAFYLPGKTVEEIRAELRGAPITLHMHEGDLNKMRDDAKEAELTLALINQALMFFSRAAEYSTDNIGGALELLARATTDEAAPWSMRLATALNDLEPVYQEDTQ